MGYLREPGSAAASILRIRWGLTDRSRTIPVPQRALFIPPPPNSPFSVFLPAFYAGVFLSMTLILAALLSAAATVRESRCLTATAFFCFALAFCGMILALCWRYVHSTEVEDSMLDVYDLVYEEVRRNGSSSKRHELTLIHEVFQCCGKHSPLGDTAAVQHTMCHPGTAWAAGQVYGMVLTSFLWFSIHFSNNLERKGKYTLRGR
uniref:Tetraspanin 32 n=1 Tax=Gallus gallus TaxID=9031 RepID=A0A8V1A5S2_CHICK